MQSNNGPCYFQWKTDGFWGHHTCFEWGKHEEHICDSGSCPARHPIVYTLDFSGIKKTGRAKERQRRRNNLKRKGK